MALFSTEEPVNRKPADMMISGEWSTGHPEDA